MTRTSSPVPGRRLGAGIAAVLAASLAACGSATATDRTASAASTVSAPASTPVACAPTVANTLGQVGERVYRAALRGTVVAEAVGRVRGSPALASAIDAGNAPAAGVALREVLR